MIWLAVVATFGATFLLVWQLLNWLVGHVRWLPKGSMIVSGGTMVSLLADSDWDEPDSPDGLVEDERHPPPGHAAMRPWLNGQR